MRFKHDYNFGVIACVLSLLTVLLAGTFGYRGIEGWGWLDSLYMTVITVSTVGFGVVRPLSPAGQLFTIVLIGLGVGIVAAAFSVIVKATFQHQLSAFLEKRGVQKEVNAMKRHIIVCGYGRMGRNIADGLVKAGRKVVVIESEPQVVDEIERHGIHFVCGDATDEDVLASAGIDRAEALVATLESDADNLFLTFTARGMNASLNIVSRTEEDSNCRKFIKAGASRVVSPMGAGTNRIIRLLTRPDVVDFVELIVEDNLQFEVSRVEVDDDSQFAGKTLAEGRVHQNIGGIVLSIRRTDGSSVFDPPSDLRLRPGDVLFVVRARQAHSS